MESVGRKSTGARRLGVKVMTRDSYRPSGGLEINYVGSESNGAGSDTEHEDHGGTWTGPGNLLRL